MLMELIIRTPKFEGEAAGNADVARQQTLLDDPAANKGMQT